MQSAMNTEYATYNHHFGYNIIIIFVFWSGCLSLQHLEPVSALHQRELCTWLLIYILQYISSSYSSHPRSRHRLLFWLYFLFLSMLLHVKLQLTAVPCMYMVHFHFSLLIPYYVLCVEYNR